MNPFFGKKYHWQNPNLLSRKLFLRIILPIATIVFLGIIPELIFPFFINKNQIIDTIEKKLKLSRLAVAYDGITISFYRGIIIHNFRISNEKDFSKGNILLKTEYLKWETDLAYLLGDQKKIPLILYANRSEFKIRIREGSLSRDVIQQLYDWKKNIAFSIQLDNPRVFFNIKTEEGKKAIYNVFFENISVMTGKNFTLKAEYNDPFWGQGSLSLKPDMKKKDYFLKGHYLWEGKNLPLTALNDILSESKFYSGIFSGKLALESDIQPDKRYRNKNKKIFILKVNSKIDYLSYMDPLKKKWKFPFLGIKSDYKISLTYDHDAIEAEGSASTKGYRIQYKFHYGDHMSLPDKLFLKVNQVSEEKLFLPFDFTLTGLEYLKIKIDPNHGKSNPYRMIDAEIKIKDGSISFPLEIDRNKTVPIEYVIPNLHFSLNQNNYKLNAYLYTPEEKNQTDGKVHLEGVIYPLIIPYAYRKRYEGYRSARDSSGLTLAWRSRHKGEFIVDQLYHDHLHLWFRYLHKLWKQKLFETMNDRDLPGSLYYSKWYYHYILYFKPNISVKVNRWVTGNSDFKNITGEFKGENQFLWISLKDPRENYLKSQIYLASNFPGISIDFDIDTLDANKILSLWLDERLVKNLGKSRVDFHLRTSGVRAKELYDSFNIKGKVESKNFIPGSDAENEIRKKWNFMVGYFYYSPYLSQVSNITLENPGEKWMGKAHLIERKYGKRLMNPYWEYKGRLTKKSQ